jgi:SAM-dependent methyltransferase
MNGECLNDLADVYDAMVDWPKRLANEGPFYRRLVDRLGARRVVDVACGTGRHAAMFHSWGLQVVGSDLSPGMIDQARRSFGEPPGLRWKIHALGDPIEAPRSVDMVICVGNSLALTPTVDTVRDAIRQMLAAVRGGGVIVVHLLNLWHLPDGPMVWQKCLRTTLPRGDVLIVKGVHRCGSQGFVHLAVTNLDGEVAMLCLSDKLMGLEAAELEQFARDAGACKVELFGSYQETLYDRSESIDLVMVAEKANR